MPKDFSYTCLWPDLFQGCLSSDGRGVDPSTLLASLSPAAPAAAYEVLSASIKKFERQLRDRYGIEVRSGAEVETLVEETRSIDVATLPLSEQSFFESSALTQRENFARLVLESPALGLE